MGILFIGAGWALFYFGGWNLIWGADVWNMAQIIVDTRSIIIDYDEVILWNRGWAVKINGLWYGLYHFARYLDPGWLRWIMGGAGLWAFFQAVIILAKGK